MNRITPWLTACLAAIVRNLRIAVRRPDLVVQTVAVPIVVLGLASVIFGATDAWPVAVVDDDGGPAATQFTQAIDATRGVSGPYFRVITTDSARAAELVDRGRLHLVVRIPEGFAEHRTVEITTYNINTDAMKNVRLRVTQASNIYDAVNGNRQLATTLRLSQPDSVTRTAFMGGSAVILALLLGSMLVAANLFALEQEIRTTRELILTPLGPAAGAIGAVGAAVVLALLTALPTALMAWLFGLRADPAGIGRAAMLVAPAMLAAAGTGVLVAQLLRTHRSVQPVVILGALASYFVTGGFIPVAALPPAARAFSAAWPPSYVFEWVNPVLHGFTDSTGFVWHGSIWFAALGGIALAAWAGRREATRPVSGGQ